MAGPSSGFDVVIVGTGPTGSAAALSLRRHFPELSVGLLESTGLDRPRAGEVLPSAAAPLLARLGVWEPFLQAQFQPAPGVASSWGWPWLVQRSSLFSPWGDGWHLDRDRFDSLLRQAAIDHAATVRRGTRISAARRTGDGWRLRLEPAAEWRTRFVLDATGRAASFARAQGAERRSIDRLVGFLRFFPAPSGGEARTLIEAVPEGWWYSARLSSRRVVALMTDADLARRLQLADKRGWRRRLDKTLWVRRLLDPNCDDSLSLVRPAGSAYVNPMSGPGWLAAGDSSFSVDPLSGGGILRALRAGLLAGYSIGPHLLAGDDSGLSRFVQLHWQEFATYLASRRRYFGEERRWPDEPFWRRRLEPAGPGPKSDAASSPNQIRP